jgi:DNA-binding CsgD family transcriptional regulator
MKSLGLDSRNHNGHVSKVPKLQAIDTFDFPEPGSHSTLLHTKRVLFCGIHDEKVVHAITEALGEVDFMFLHSTEPDTVTPYLRQFSPNLLILGNCDSRTSDDLIRLVHGATHTEGRHLSLAATITERLKLPRVLTERQAEVLQYLENGCSNKQIAEYMGVQPRTVKEWLTDLYRVFFVSNRTELVGRLNEINRQGSLTEPSDMGDCRSSK